MKRGPGGLLASGQQGEGGGTRVGHEKWPAAVPAYPTDKSMKTPDDDRFYGRLQATASTQLMVSSAVPMRCRERTVRERRCAHWLRRAGRGRTCRPGRKVPCRTPKALLTNCRSKRGGADDSGAAAVPPRAGGADPAVAPTMVTPRKSTWSKDDYRIGLDLCMKSVDALSNAADRTTDKL